MAKQTKAIRIRPGGQSTAGPKSAPKPAADANDDETAPAALPAPRPFKPHRNLFIALCVAFALWVSALLALYFVTVYPHRNDQRYFIPNESGQAEPAP